MSTPSAETVRKALRGVKDPALIESVVRAPLGRRILTAARNPVLVAITIIAVAAPLNTALLARDKNIELIERGLTTREVQ